MHLAARAAGAGIGHGPEVVLHAQGKDALLGYAHFQPVFFGLVIAGNAFLAFKNGGVELVFGNAKPCFGGHEFPGISNSIFLEVVAKAEIAQHLKERMMALGEAHILKIVVLATRADALLGGGGAGVIALLQPQEHVFELVHAGIGEEQGGVIRRNQRRRVDTAVSFAFKEAQKCFSDFGASGHPFDFNRQNPSCCLTTA